MLFLSYGEKWCIWRNEVARVLGYNSPLYYEKRKDGNYSSVFGPQPARIRLEVGGGSKWRQELDLFFLQCLRVKKSQCVRASVVCFMFLNMVDEEELWIEWTCLVNFMAFGFENQIVLLQYDFVDVLFLFCCSVLVLTKSKGKWVEDLRKYDGSVQFCHNLWVIDMSFENFYGILYVLMA